VHFHILDVSSITPNKRTLYIYYTSVPYFSYVFRCISHHPQGELTFSLFKTIYIFYILWLNQCTMDNSCVQEDGFE